MGLPRLSWCHMEVLKQGWLVKRGGRGSQAGRLVAAAGWTPWQPRWLSLLWDGRCAWLCWFREAQAGRISQQPRNFMEIAPGYTVHGGEDADCGLTVEEMRPFLQVLDLVRRGKVKARIYKQMLEDARQKKLEANTHPANVDDPLVLALAHAEKRELWLKSGAPTAAERQDDAMAWKVQFRSAIERAERWSRSRRGSSPRVMPARVVQMQRDRRRTLTGRGVLAPPSRARRLT